MIELAHDEYSSLMKKAKHFDNQLMADARKAGGEKYAELCALAYRQSIAAHKLVEAPNGDLLFLSKENFSNGSIGTVDITILLTNVPVLQCGISERTMNHIFTTVKVENGLKPFAAHDVGTYPLPTRTNIRWRYAMEESGNIADYTTAAVAAIEGTC